MGDDEWAFFAPYLTLMTEVAPQCGHSPYEAINGLRWISPYQRTIAYDAQQLVTVAHGLSTDAAVVEDGLSNQPAHLPALAITLVAATRLSLLATIIVGVVSAGLLRSLMYKETSRHGSFA